MTIEPPPSAKPLRTGRRISLRCFFRSCLQQAGPGERRHRPFWARHRAHRAVYKSLRSQSTGRALPLPGHPCRTNPPRRCHPRLGPHNWCSECSDVIDPFRQSLQYDSISVSFDTVVHVVSVCLPVSLRVYIGDRYSLRFVVITVPTASGRLFSDLEASSRYWSGSKHDARARNCFRIRPSSADMAPSFPWKELLRPSLSNA